MMTVNITNIIPVIIIFQSAMFAFVLFTDRGPKKVSIAVRNRVYGAIATFLSNPMFFP